MAGSDVGLRGGALPYLVKDFRPGLGNTFSPEGTLRTVNVNGSLFFINKFGHSSGSLWKTDGTTQGTSSIRHLFTFPLNRNSMVPCNGKLLFVANDGIGFRLWRSDGTDEGTELVKDLALPYAGFFVSYSILAPLGNDYFFVGQNTSQLWKTDGTPSGTALVRDLDLVAGRPGFPFGIEINFLTSTSSKIFMLVRDIGDGRRMLCTSDGTASGTQLVKVLEQSQGYQSVEPEPIIGAQDKVFFTLSTTKKLWCSDGTSSNTIPLGDLGATNWTAVGNILYFLSSDETHGAELYKNDGTPQGTKLIRDIVPGNSGSIPREITPLGSGIMFTAYDGTRRTLWKSDGTSEGTIVVKPANQSTSSSMFITDPQQLFNAGNVLYFFAKLNGNSQYLGLWKTDGTDSGTVLVKPMLNPEAYALPNGTSVPSPGFCIGPDQAVYFGAYELFPSYGFRPFRLWRTDGTTTGTYSISRALPADSQIELWTELNGNLLLNANNSLWRSDGSPLGTVQLDNFDEVTSSIAYVKFIDKLSSRAIFRILNSPNGGAFWSSNGLPGETIKLTDQSSSPSDFRYAIADNQLFFFGDDGIHGMELWRTDGTPTGTMIARDITSGTQSSTSTQWQLAAFGSSVLYPAGDGFAEAAVWKSDGTTSGTQPILDLSGNLELFVEFKGDIGGRKIFALNDGTGKRDLWSTDGSASGNIKLIAALNDPMSNFETMNGSLYFVAFSSDILSLYKTDGTTSGTTIVRQLSSLASFPTIFSKLHNNKLIVGIHGASLWVSDGTTGGSFQLNDATKLFNQSSLYHLSSQGPAVFFGKNQDGDPSLWRTDGTNGGTVLLRNLPKYTSLGEPAVSGNSLYFVMTDFYGKELWHTDGTQQGSGMVMDIYSGLIGSSPFFLTDVNGILYFSAMDNLHGRELWRTQGTPASTRRISDIAPGQLDSDPKDLMLVGDTLFFTADDQWTTGRELWAIQSPSKTAVTSWAAFE